MLLTRGLGEIFLLYLPGSKDICVILELDLLVMFVQYYFGHNFLESLFLEASWLSVGTDLEFSQMAQGEYEEACHSSGREEEDK